MQLILAAVGRMRQGPERELLTRYADRTRAMARTVGLTGFALREIDESRARSAPERRREEARALAEGLPPNPLLVALDAGGDALSSPDFASAIGRARDAGRSALVLAIGGPDGLDAAILEGAGRVAAYGRATFPHQLVRVLAAEQCYRALTILAGHPYHRA